MRGYKVVLTTAAILIAFTFMVSGCAVNFYKQSPRSAKKIGELEAKVNTLEAQREAERQKFEEVRRMLESQLKDLIDKQQVSLQMDERGLVIVLSDAILFDSGKAEIKPEAYQMLDDLSGVIVGEVPDKNIGVSGHTDNEPIKQSKWKSNWELSTARATNVLH
ncbi:MAG: OmpA family protein [Candidatus Omnitrophica bacterium]|nr:OmpA family protein [Candidatus Omnitrophota bacterium]